MTDSEIQASIANLTLYVGLDLGGPKEHAYFAMYEEMPGCVAIGASASEAEAELAAIAIGYVRLLVDAGASAPVKLCVAQTQQFTVSGWVTGGIAAASAAIQAARSVASPTVERTGVLATA